jgi:hypothetical protein
MRSSNSVDDRLTHAFRRVMGRKPTRATSRSSGAPTRRRRRSTPGRRGGEGFLSVGESKRDETLNTTEHAALSAVCLAILNLDEALTRE